MLQILEESALRLVSQFVFHDAQGMHQVLMVSRLIAVHSVCLEILPVRKRLVAHALEQKASEIRRNLSSYRLDLSAFMLQWECFL